MNGRILVTGGAGFIGSNLVSSLLRDGCEVTILDAMLRAGCESNLRWLVGQKPNGRLRFIKGDVRDFETVREAATGIDVIFHVAGQVAVTSSVLNPREDFDINASGTLNVLEAARLGGREPVVVFTSTNKVYGGMEEVPVIERDNRYEYSRLPHGVSESQPLDFHSPYGCSKGTADQYVRDYARIYGLPTVVFRMSCIYGPRQFGTEDQGWLAHFMKSAARGKPITIYGDGKQVRDVLYVEDLVRAFRLAVEMIDTTAGEVFNIGGGPARTLSVWAEFGDLIARFNGNPVPVLYDEWRAGDQPCYVSDIRKADRMMDWRPAVDMDAGVSLLWEWISTLTPAVPHSPPAHRTVPVSRTFVS